MTQVVQRLPSKHEALNSNPVTTPSKKKKELKPKNISTKFFDKLIALLVTYFFLIFANYASLSSYSFCVDPQFVHSKPDITPKHHHFGYYKIRPWLFHVSFPAKNVL
jgi:hypothetical protein